MKFCQYCNQQVQPRKHINWFILALMCLLTGGGWLFVYVPYYFLFKSEFCPICGGKFGRGALSAQGTRSLFEVDGKYRRTGKANVYGKMPILAV